MAATITGMQLVEGVEIEHGLVLHASTDERETGFTISEPRSGRSICHGATRPECLARLRETVASWGGPAAFCRTVDFSVMQLLKHQSVPATANWPCGSLGEEVPHA